MNVRKVNNEVLFARGEIVKLRRKDVAVLKKTLGRNESERIRLCAHERLEDRLHEMFIVLKRGTYVRPHKHLRKAESLLVLEGAAEVLLFTDDGALQDVIRMGGYLSERPFYYRTRRPRYHTVLVRSDVLVFHESTSGPFDRSETLLAPWAPPVEDRPAVEQFLKRQRMSLRKWASRS